jgi:S1-C subfamily serine protease
MKTIKKGNKVILVLLIVVAFAAGIFAAFFAVAILNGKAVFMANNLLDKRAYVEESAMISAVKRAMPAVVSIEVGNNNALLKNKDVLGGTGFVFDKSGLVFTNKHLVIRTDKNSYYKVTFGDGKEYRAVLVSKDPFDDVAILKLEVAEDEIADFPVVNFGDSDNLAVGQKVLAIGNALVKYPNSVSAGIVSGLGRDISAYYYDFKGPSENLSGLIQTDAAINLGNSGGPLINLDGEVVGMITALEENVEGIGFVIPANDLKPNLDSIKRYGEIVRPVLGVRYVMLTLAQAVAISQNLEYGALIVGDKVGFTDPVLKKSNAYTAGLREGDVILSVNGQKLDLENSLNKVVRNFEPGAKISLVTWRKGTETTIEVVLNSSKDFE